MKLNHPAYPLMADFSIRAECPISFQTAVKNSPRETQEKAYEKDFFML
jgi:hypothetical protein